MSLRSSLENLRTEFDLKRILNDLNFGQAVGSVRHLLPDSLEKPVIDIKVIAKQDDFKIVLCTLKRLLKGVERPVIECLSKFEETSHNLIVFTDESNHEFHFTNLLCSNIN